MNRAIYLDMDGVLADFDAAIRARGVQHDPSGHFLHLPRAQWTDAQVAADDAVRAEMSKPDFWPALPVMPGARELLAVATSLVGTERVAILTALPRDQAVRDMVDAQKRAWCSTHLGLAPGYVITCLRSEKRNFSGYGRVLVDDLPSNCAEWRGAGGVAIQYADAPSAVAQLMEACLEPA